MMIVGLHRSQVVMGKNFYFFGFLSKRFFGNLLKTPQDILFDKIRFQREKGEKLEPK